MKQYIFRDSQIGRRFAEALSEKARQGVQVKLLLDANHGLIARLEAAFTVDVTRSQRVEEADWKKRSLLQRPGEQIRGRD